MKQHHKQFFYHVLLALCFAFTLFMAIYLLSQIKSLGQEIKNQTDINQRYLRCILLIERDKFQNVETRVAAIDKCAIESKTPDGEPTGTQPTSQQQKNFSQPVTKAEPLPTTPTGGTSNPPKASPPTQTSEKTQTVAQPQPSLLEQVTKPVKDLLNL